MIITATLGLAMALQLTPKRLYELQARKKQAQETRAGRKLLPGDPIPGTKYLGMSFGGRIREIDRMMTDFGAEEVAWPHRLDGKVYDDLDFNGREKLMAKQMHWVDAHDGYPELSFVAQINNPRSRYYVEKHRRYVAKLRKLRR